MNEDYLWDKTGEDPEIERLENALAAFRYRETAPPVIAAAAEIPVVENSAATTILPFRRRRATRFLPLAAAACIAFIFIGSSILWRQTSNDEIAVSGETINAQTQKSARVAETAAPPPQTKNAASGLPPSGRETKDSTAKNSNLVKIRKLESRKAFAGQKSVPALKIVSAPQKKSALTARSESADNKTGNRNVRLTADERHAYSQLLLALSITHSKLNLVKDKLDNVREQTAVVKDAR